MNDHHMQQIFQHYIDKFEMLNNPEHREYYKWQIVKSFRSMMDAALQGSDEEFPSRLKEIKISTSNLIDSYTQPLSGLVKFAEESTEVLLGFLESCRDCIFYSR